MARLIKYCFHDLNHLSRLFGSVFSYEKITYNFDEANSLLKETQKIHSKPINDMFKNDMYKLRKDLDRAIKISEQAQ